jgi:uncharacterized protein YicC (UPF0701 family)
MSTDEAVHLLDDLRSLLEKQIKLAQQGNISEVEVLSRQAGSLVEKIEQTRILESAEFENRRERLQKLYDSLCLAVTAQRADIAEELSRVRKGKKTVRTYRSNV